MFLSADELLALTGLRRPSAQFAWLRAAQRLAAHSDVRTTRGYYADVPKVRV